MTPDVIVIGGGLSGLVCARELARGGLVPLVLEANGHVGGRIATDRPSGFRVDRGFQVLLTSYPLATELLDLARLDLATFEPGARVRQGGRWHLVADPWRRPAKALGSLRAPFLSIADGLRLARLRSFCRRRPEQAPDTTARDWLRDLGFSPSLVESFFQPFFGGVTLEPELRVPARRFARLFGWFSTGSAALPAGGMQAIPEQVANELPEDSLRLNAPAERVFADRVVLRTGEELRARAVVLATDGASAEHLLGREPRLRFTGTVGLAYGTLEPLASNRLLALRGDGPNAGPVAHVAIPSEVQPTYAPPGRSLVVATGIGIPPGSDDELDTAARTQLEDWYGPVVRDWERLAVHRIPRALPLLPDPPPATGEPAAGPFVCGDHTTDPSIQGTLASGAACAARVRAALAR